MGGPQGVRCSCAVATKHWSANGGAETRDVRLMSQQVVCVGLKPASRTDACPARWSQVLVFRAIHGRRRPGEPELGEEGGRQLVHRRPHTQERGWEGATTASGDDSACLEAVQRMNACRRCSGPTQGYR
jgi:hypothetical protein